jgi:diacylglycerol kinase (ATP)
MNAKVILNPYAARWNALKRKPEAESGLQAAEVAYELVTSQAPGHGIELAAQAVQDGFDPIIAAGGDSTFNEVVNGILHAVGGGLVEVNFGILPMGTANDLADNLKIPKDLEEAARVIARNQTRWMDVCRVNDRYFVNNSAIGLETTVTVIQSNLKRVRGVARYLLATLIAIYRNPQWTMDLTWDDGEYSGPATMVSVGNNPRTGGIFYTVPNADPFDGKLSFVHGAILSRGEILRTLPKTMKAGEGNYIEHANVHEIHCTWLKVHTEPTTPVHTDGEVLDEAIQDLEYSIHPKRIPILL